jgi:hypothetical protein
MAVNAAGGAWYALSGAPDVPTEWLERTPFDDYRVPGVILGTIVAGSQVAAGVALLRRSRHARHASQAASGVLLGWIATQLAMIGYRSPLQPIVLGWSLASLALAERADLGTPRAITGPRG